MDVTRLIGPLIMCVIGVALIVAELRITSLKSVAGGLGVGVLGGGVMMVVQTFYDSKWHLSPYLIGGAIGALLAVSVAAIRQREYRRKLAALEDAVASGSVAASAAKPVPGAISESGLTFYARNYGEHFKTATGVEFGDYIRTFVLSSAPGTTLKIIGIDWTELFGAAISATSEKYRLLLNDKRTAFRVLLLDPRSRVGSEKRQAEFLLAPGAQPRYVPNHPERIYGKVLGSVSIAADYHLGTPDQFQIRFTPDLPMVAAVMNGDTAIFYFYSKCHKGWDSPVFMARRINNGIYDFIEEYFDFMWQYPTPLLADQQWTEQFKKLQPTIEQFTQILSESCTGPAHANCQRPS